MHVEYSTIYDEAAAQRNKAMDDLASMTAYARACEARITELEQQIAAAAPAATQTETDLSDKSAALPGTIEAMPGAIGVPERENPEQPATT